MGYKGLQGRGEHRSRVPLPEPRPHDGDIGRHKRRQDEPANVCCVLKSRDAWTGGEREAYQLMGHKVWTQEIVRTRYLQTSIVTMDLKR
jgi:hypothetical protein